jgi:hypothetical protein
MNRLFAYHVGDRTSSIGTPLAHNAQSVSIHLFSCPSSAPPLVFNSLLEGEEGERGEEEGIGEVGSDRGDEDWRARSIVAEESSSGLSSPLFPFPFSPAGVVEVVVVVVVVVVLVLVLWLKDDTLLDLRLVDGVLLDSMVVVCAWHATH